MLCRLCLINVENDGVLLFNTHDNNWDYMTVQMIAKYLHLLLTKNDAISTTICQKCFSHLEAFHTFSSYVERQQCTLRHQYVQVEEQRHPATETDVKTAYTTEYAANECTIELTNPIELKLKIEPEESIFTPETEMANNDDHLMQDSSQHSNYDQTMEQTSPDYISTDFTVDLSAANDDKSTYAEANNTYSMSKILFSRIFFRVIKQLDSTLFQQLRGGALVQCCICDCRLKGSTQVTSNLIRHLKLKHPDSFEEYKRMKAERQSHLKSTTDVTSKKAVRKS